MEKEEVKTKTKELRKQIEKSSVNEPTDLKPLFGLFKDQIKGDPVKLQRKWRDADR